MPIKDKDLELRRSFKMLLLENPNYFGNLSDLKLPNIAAPVQKKVADTTFEELTCLGYNPETRDLGAIIHVKLTSGYAGGPCTDGSKEYVRFYLDYGDGDWVDEGVVNFDAHDLPFGEELCYAVRLRLDPKRRSCCDRKPVLPKVRAILSWNVSPPPDVPNWMPVWGNRLECDIQIEPRQDIFCNLIDIFGTATVGQVETAALEELAASVVNTAAVKPLPVAPLLDLKKSYGKKVEDARIGHKALHGLAIDPTDLAAAEQVKLIGAAGLDIGKIVDFLKAPDFDTTYEELTCVGLDRDASMLHANIRIKRAFGYSGNLCQSGSREYVAFYLDFGDGWEYIDTTSVNVHDIPEVNGGELCYLATLPVSLTKRQMTWCETGKARIRGILSWNVPPTPNDPDYVASWGDWEECCIEIRPLPPGVEPGELTPFIDTVGSMPINKINPLGYANGESLRGLNAQDSPFDGRIEITGTIFGAPSSGSGLRYRLMVKDPLSVMAQPLIKEFEIVVATISNGIPTMNDVVQQPDAEGWVMYRPDSDTLVGGNRLGIFTPSEEGLHEIHIEVDDPGLSINVPPSAPIPFMVDRTSPIVDINITSGSGNCGKFSVGALITGNFSMSDSHNRHLSLAVTPSDRTNGTAPEIVGTTGRSGLSYADGSLPGGGSVSGFWELDTSSMEPCGYNIRITGVDRAIVNSAVIGHAGTDVEGFCLDE